MNMKRYLVIAAILLVIVLLPFSITVAQTVPEEGRWYCEDWNVTFDRNEKTCVAFIDGKEVICQFRNNRGSKYFSIINQDVNFKDFDLGEAIFSGECIRYDETVMVIKEKKTEKICYFYRIDRPDEENT